MFLVAEPVLEWIRSEAPLALTFPATACKLQMPLPNRNTFGGSFEADHTVHLGDVDGEKLRTGRAATGGKSRRPESRLAVATRGIPVRVTVQLNKGAPDRECVCE